MFILLEINMVGPIALMPAAWTCDSPQRIPTPENPPPAAGNSVCVLQPQPSLFVVGAFACSAFCCCCCHSTTSSSTTTGCITSQQPCSCTASAPQQPATIEIGSSRRSNWCPREKQCCLTCCCCTSKPTRPKQQPKTVHAGSASARRGS